MARPDRNAHSEDAAAAGSSLNLAVLPEPGETSNQGSPASRGDADDLIAQLADRQIDGLMAEEDFDPPSDRPRDAAADAATELALQAASELDAIADDLCRNTATLVEREVEESATQQTATPAVVAVATPTFAAKPIDDEPVADESEAVPAAAQPSFNPPRQADVDRGTRPDEVASQDAGHASSADAVARELAADAALSPRSSAVAAEADLTIEPHDSPLPSGAPWRIALGYVTAAPRMMLAAINLPAQPLGDGGREVIGAVAIVTLVNAMALLLYLMIYAR